MHCWIVNQSNRVDNFHFISDVNEIYSRIFQQRQFLTGEINYFLKEFEVRLQWYSKWSCWSCDWIYYDKDCNFEHIFICLLIIRLFAATAKRSWSGKSICIGPKYNWSKGFNHWKVFGFMRNQSSVTENQTGRNLNIVWERAEPRC